MNKLRVTYLFRAYFNKTATPAERDEFMALLEQAENDALVKDLLAESWEQYANQSQLFNDSQGEKMLAAILQKDRLPKRVIVMKPGRSSRWWRVAAAAAILLFMVTGGYFWLQNKQRTQQAAQPINTAPAHNAIVPGSNKAVLTLADGSKITLDSTNQGILTKQGNVKVSNLNTAVLAYKADSWSQPVSNVLTTPRGGQYQLQLADGTKVWLNASSSLSYPVSFKGKERIVMLVGEAYFEVAKNPAMPFKVLTRDAHVEVLGTHFNISSYDDESSTNTTLLEGSVKVSTNTQHKILAPGQQSKATPAGTMRVGEADIEEVMAWKNGWFQFNAYDIERIMRQVSRWYDVDILYEGKIPTDHFTGIVSRQNNIDQVLKIMQAGGVGFKIEGRKVTVYDNAH